MATGLKGILSILRQAHVESRSGAVCEKPTGGGIAALLTTPKFEAPRKLQGEWKPRPRTKRVAIVIDASPRRLSVLRQATAMIENLYTAKTLEPGQLHTKILYSMDDCLHTTDWGTSPKEVGNGTRWAHCHQGKTQFTDALRRCDADIKASSIPIDAVLVIGDRCDECPADLEAAARRLANHGTKIFAFQVGTSKPTAKAYRAISAATGGLYLPLSRELSLSEVLTPVVDFLFRGSDALLPLERSANPDVRQLSRALLPDDKHRRT